MPRIWAKKLSSVMFLGLKRWKQMAAYALRKLGFQGWSREPMAAETYFGNCELVVMLTASALGDVFSMTGASLTLGDDQLWLG